MQSLQFELWQECNSLCKYCYLGTDNRNTPDDIKLNSLRNTIEKISDLSLYQGEHPVEVLSYLGGEFFQGQLNTPEIRDEFFKLMEKTAELFNSQVIKQVWIYATMTIGDQKNLYDTLKLFDMNKGDFWLLTSYDTVGRFHNQKMFDNWDYHMKNIHEKYPLIKFNTTTIITQDLINKYLSGIFSFKEFMNKYHTAMFFKQCGTGNMTKEFLQSRMDNLFFPKRNDMIRFLMKFHEEEGPELYDKLFNIYYRADDLYRNYNNISESMKLIHRDKTSKNEEQMVDGEISKLPCGHLINYMAYSDCNECVMCDKLKVKKIMEAKQYAKK